MDGRGTESLILITEDGAAFRKALERMLSTAGYRVESVASGDAALTRILDPSQPSVDLLLADLRLPGKSGSDVIAEAKSGLADPPACLLMSGAPAAAPTRGQAAEPILLKPFGADELLSSVARALAAR